MMAKFSESSLLTKQYANTQHGIFVEPEGRRERSPRIILRSPFLTSMSRLTQSESSSLDTRLLTLITYSRKDKIVSSFAS